ncbi:lipopolysaccharide transport periplasmic protein LptA [Undibacterium sp. RuRC25W]|uniref:lipopolysaccharide transport periplasmic protein LptA n=1 Tax=Undibacterium sp. RuRC25W TaxID=3413047 RepID=UPI003BF31D15
MRLTLISTRQIVSSIVFFGLCTSVVLSAHAEKADSKKEMVIEADHLISDGKTNVTTCSGDVHITKGTLVVSAERAVASKTPDDFQNVKLYAKAGGKVRFRQKRDGGPDLWVEGEAERAEYDEKTEFIKFISRAKVRYLEGSKVTDEQEGEYLSYDSKNDVFVGSNTSNGTAVSGGGRIRLTIQPKNDK